MTKNMTMQEKVDWILQQAAEKGITSDFFFSNTLKQYSVQVDTLTKLEKSIREHGTLVTKEYVKGRQNLVVNPAISEYNKTATAANNTVATLLKIMNSIQPEGSSENKLQALINQINGEE